MGVVCRGTQSAHKLSVLADSSVAACSASYLARLGQMVSSRSRTDRFLCRAFDRNVDLSYTY